MTGTGLKDPPLQNSVGNKTGCGAEKKHTTRNGFVSDVVRAGPLAQPVLNAP